MKKLFLLTLFAYAFAHAGSFAGNGTDTHPSSTHAAWFLNSGRSINWCIHSSELLVTENVSAALKSSFGLWGDYIKNKKIFKGSLAQTPSTSLAPRPTCNEETDLNIYIGSENEVVKKYLHMYPNTNSFSRRLSFEESWSNGFIWISESSSKDATLTSSLILHQLGHVFGTGHFSGTIMEEKYSTQAAPTMSIDHSRELVRCLACGMSIAGKSFGKAAVLTSYARGNTVLVKITTESTVTNFSLGELISRNIVESDHLFFRSVDRDLGSVPTQIEIFSLKATGKQAVIELGMEKYIRVILFENSEYKSIFESNE